MVAADGERIRAWLRARGLNTRQFATRHDLDYPSVINTLSGRRGIGPRMLVALADEGCSISDIVRRDPDVAAASRDSAARA